MAGALEADVMQGGYWMVAPGADAEIAIVASGAVLPEARAALEILAEDIPGAGLLVVTSADRLMQDWQAASRAGRRDSHAHRLLARLPGGAGIVTVLDGHPATLSWLAGVARHRIQALGVEDFGRSADIPDLYRVHGLDADAIVDAAARLCLGR